MVKVANAIACFTLALVRNLRAEQPAPTCDADVESLLQHTKRAQQAWTWTEAAPGLSFEQLEECSVEPWDCAEGTDTSTAALQMINLNGATACSLSEIKRLDLATGSYTPVCQFTQGHCFNACGVNPADSKIYCAAWGPALNISRTDDTRAMVRVECPLPNQDGPGVGKVCVLGETGRTFSAGFGTDGNYLYLLNSNAYLVGNLNVTPGYTTQPGTDLRGTLLRQFQFNPADLVIIEADLDGQGKAEWAVGCAGDDVYIESLNTTEQYRIAMTGSRLPAASGLSGAQWSFDNRVYCAYNADTDGVFEIELDQIDIDSRTVPVREVSASETTGSNDGLNCINAQSPFPNSTIPPPTTTTTTTTTTT
ncbi:unnamed protein product, partial [Effrenium voratum]